MRASLWYHTPLEDTLRKATSHVKKQNERKTNTHQDSHYLQNDLYNFRQHNEENLHDLKNKICIVTYCTEKKKGMKIESSDPTKTKNGE